MRVLGVLGGNGVILFPFKKYLVGNIEIRSIFHTKGMEQWKANFGAIPYIKDYSLTLKPSILRTFPDIDVIIGCPDCGHSSLLAYSRAKKLSDPNENLSLRLFIRSISIFSPKVFLMENLPKLLEQFTEEDFRKKFNSYNLIFHKVSVSEFGNSQKNRIRLILIGIKKTYDEGFKEGLRDHFSNIYKVSELKKAGELIKGLEKEDYKMGNIREPIEDIITIYSGVKLSLQDIQQYWQERPGQRRFLVTGRRFSTAPAVYRNLLYDNPATARKANRQFNHHGLQLTPRELARIQGLPDRFKIHINMDNPKYWVNKGRATITKTAPYQVSKWFYKQCKEIF